MSAEGRTAPTTAAATPAVAFEGLAAGYGDRAIVSGVDLAVAPGEVVGIVGPNGAGKTTLLRAVTGAAKVLGGRVTLGGRDAASMGARQVARVVGVLPQAVESTFAFTARAFVEMGRNPWRGRFGGMSAEDRAAVERAMALTDTGRLAGSQVATLSGGDLQRVVLAQALAQEPRVLLLDEPTSHLDLDHQLQVLDLARELASGGMAVLGVFHDLTLAARYADRLAVVARGTLALQGAPEEVLTTGTLAEVFGVRAVVGVDPATGSLAVSPLLRGPRKTPDKGRVLVVGGSGTGAAVVRRLVVAGFDVALAALNAGDTDAEVATALGLEHVTLPPFGAVDAEAEAAVAALAAQARAVVVCATPFGRANLGNLRAALSAGLPVVLLAPPDPSRDFTDGEASGMLEAALAAGARVAEEASAVPALVEEVVG